MPGTNSTTERPEEAMVADIQGMIEEIARLGAQQLLQRKRPPIPTLWSELAVCHCLSRRMNSDGKGTARSRACGRMEGEWAESTEVL